MLVVERILFRPIQHSQLAMFAILFAFIANTTEFFNVMFVNVYVYKRLWKEKELKDSETVSRINYFICYYNTMVRVCETMDKIHMYIQEACKAQ